MSLINRRWKLQVRPARYTCIRRRVCARQFSRRDYFPDTLTAAVQILYVHTPPDIIQRVARNEQTGTIYPSRGANFFSEIFLAQPVNLSLAIVIRNLHFFSPIPAATHLSVTILFCCRKMSLIVCNINCRTLPLSTRF